LKTESNSYKKTTVYVTLIK